VLKLKVRIDHQCKDQLGSFSNIMEWLGLVYRIHKFTVNIKLTHD